MQRLKTSGLPCFIYLCVFSRIQFARNTHQSYGGKSRHHPYNTYSEIMKHARMRENAEQGNPYYGILYAVRIPEM